MVLPGKKRIQISVSGSANHSKRMGPQAGVKEAPRKKARPFGGESTGRSNLNFTKQLVVSHQRMKWANRCGQAIEGTAHHGAVHRRFENFDKVPHHQRSKGLARSWHHG
jgi:hypothetical protein